jgi:membrane protease subunit HflK
MADILETQEEKQLRETPLDAGAHALSEALRSSFGIVKFLMGILVVLFFASGFFVVGPQERAMVLRLGKPVAEGPQALLGPGWHFALPYPIDEVIKVPITGIQQVTSKVGWFAVTDAQEAAGIEPAPAVTINPVADGYVLTADENIVHTRATVTYHINDPVRFVFGFVNASNALQNAVGDALIYAAARYKVDDVLTRDIIGFNDLVRSRVESLVNKQDLGVVIDQCTVRSIPPRQVKEAFDNVLRAEVTRSKVLNEAHSFENQVLSKASADAQSRTNLAQSDRVRLVQDISSRADQFQQLLPKYRQNPSLFVQQRRTETLGRAITNTQDRIFIAESIDGKPRELRLLLNRPPPTPKIEAPGTGQP